MPPVARDVESSDHDWKKLLPRRNRSGPARRTVLAPHRPQFRLLERPSAWRKLPLPHNPARAGETSTARWQACIRIVVCTTDAVPDYAYDSCSADVITLEDERVVLQRGEEPPFESAEVRASPL